MVLSVSLQVVSLDNFLVKHTSHNVFLIVHFFLLFWQQILQFDLLRPVPCCSKMCQYSERSESQTTQDLWFSLASSNSQPGGIPVRLV